MSNDTVDKRHYSRISFDANATIIAVDEEWQTELIDVSLNGALVKLPDTWQGKTDEQYKLALLLAEGEVTIQMDVTVSHIEDGHIGFHCDHIDYDSIVHLKRLMELNLGDAELVNRELSGLG